MYCVPELPDTAHKICCTCSSGKSQDKMCEVRSTNKSLCFRASFSEGGQGPGSGLLTPDASDVSGSWECGELGDRKLEDGSEARCKVPEALRLAWRFVALWHSVACGREVIK